MRRLTCSDLGLGACKHILEAEDDEKLLDEAEKHARERHPEATFDRDAARSLIKPAG